MIIVPDLKTEIQASKFGRAQNVNASDFGKQVEQLNRIYARSLGQSAGLVFETDWTTSSSTFTTDPLLDVYDLKTWTGLMFLERPGLVGGIDVNFSAYGSGIIVRTVLTRINSDQTTGSFINDFSSGPTDDWFGGAISFTNASRRSDANAANAPAAFALTVQARSLVPPTVGRLDSFIFYEQVLEAGDMP